MYGLRDESVAAFHVEFVIQWVEDVEGRIKADGECREEGVDKKQRN